MRSLFSKDDFKSKYTMGDTIGHGNYAEVKLATCKKTNEQFAVKVVKIRDRDDYEFIKQEIEIIGRLDHPNIVRLVEVFEHKSMRSGKKVLIVMELVTGGELFDRVIDQSFLKESEARDVVRTVVGAIQYMHANGVVHRDLKPENILMANERPDSPIKIADFGLSKLYTPQESEFLYTMCGTPAYVAPEIIKKQGYGPEVDMWSTGVILYLLLCGYPPFFDDDRAVLFSMIVRGEFDFPELDWKHVSAEAKDFVCKLLVVDPAKRLTPAQALKHPWMQVGAERLSVSLQIDHLKKFQERVRVTKRWRRAKNVLVAAQKFHAISNPEA